MPDQTEANADGRPSLYIARPDASLTVWDALGIGCGLAALGLGGLACLAWLVLLPGVGLCWLCGWLK